MGWDAVFKAAGGAGKGLKKSWDDLLGGVGGGKNKVNLELPNATNKGNREYGSYTNHHESGKKCHGQGDKKRSQTSGKERAIENEDPHTATDWTPAESRREAMKDEARRIEGDGGIESPDNYNKINSPGKRYLEEDGE